MKKGLIIMLISLSLNAGFVIPTQASESIDSYTLSETNVVYKIEKKIIIIDYCHRAVNNNGVVDRGASSELYGRVFYEDDIANHISYNIGKRLENEGYNVIYTRPISGTISLKERVDLCKKIPQSSLYFSLHLNASENYNASGIMGFSNSRQELSKLLVDKLSDKYGFKNRNSHSDPYYTKNIKNSILFELAFIDSEKDMKIVLNNEKEIADDIAEIIIDYLE